MAAGSISAPAVIPLRIPTSFSKSKLNIDTNTPIELSSTTSNVKIYYTVNGTKPNPFERDFKNSSTFPYSNPFTLGVGKHTIKALAINFEKQAESGIVTKILTVSEPVKAVCKDEKTIAEKQHPPTPSKLGVTKTLSKQPPMEVPEIKPVTPPSSLRNSKSNSARPSSGKATSITFEDEIESPLKLPIRPSSLSLSHISNSPSMRSSEVLSTVQDTIKILQETNYLQCIFCFSPRPADPFSRYCPQCSSSLPILPSSAKDLTMPPPGTIGQCLQCKCSVPLNHSKCVVCEANLTPRLMPQSSQVLKEKLLCLSCGTANPDGTLKCLTCENFLTVSNDKHPKIPHILEHKKCPFCSGFNGAHNVFCVACGYQLQAKAAMTDNASIQTLDNIDDEEKTTHDVETQTQGLFFPSSKAISLKSLLIPNQEEAKKRETAKTLKPFSPGKGFWRQQTDHVCGHLRSYIQANADFQQTLGQPCLGRIKNVVLHTDDQAQAVMQIYINLKPQTEEGLVKEISKLKLDEEDSVSSESSSYKKPKTKTRKKAAKSSKSVDDHLLLKEITSGAREQVIEQLLEGGANANSLHAGKPILNKAIEADCILYIIELLIRHGADVNLSDKNGNTSLHIAVKNGEYGVDLIKMLLEHDGDPLLKNSKGDSVYMLAANCEPLMQCLSAHIGSSTLHAEVTSKQNLSSLLT